MSEEEKPGFILPIMCPHCSKELNLEIDFNLLPPKDLDTLADEVKEEIKNDITQENPTK